uniref:Serine proteinase inhibitor, clade B, member 3 (Predicted) n=1 Tax=Plecturocebus moloch TaxID=9523 RepID=B1MTC0_PLEMO|nr:serine proteinase inhibitor, clade B, member 3 (predicted) [Plecturocebus moloch]
MNSLSEANTQFLFDMFQQFRKSKENNIFYSPMSITSALGMVLLGAKENTAQQISKVLHFDQVTENTTGKAALHQVDNSGNVHHQFQKLLTELNKSTDAYELKIANKLFGEKTYQFLKEYLDAIKKYYQTSVESVDFVKAPEESRQKINSWVESQTNEKIKNLFPNESISSLTILVLVNAIYFKGQWEKKFNKEDTKEEKFWPNKNTYKPIQMMRQYMFSNFALLEDVQAKVLEIPYKAKDLSMIVLLPNEIDGLQKLEEKLTAEKLMKWTSLQNMRQAHVNLHFPRFKVEETYDLKDTLETMGMVDIFSGDADLSGMTGRRGLVVSKVLHKAFVEVTEEGAEAAAATGIVTEIGSAPSTDEEFHCNHPFLFFIRENKTNSILFFGRFSSP